MTRDDFDTMTLTDQLPTDADPDTLLDAFTTWTTEQGIELYPAQEEALMEVVTGANPRIP